MTTEEILRKQVTDLEGQLEELRDEYDLLRENAAGGRLDARNIQGKFDEVCKQMWAALNSCIEDGTKYLGVAMPDIKRQLVHLNVLEGDYLSAQQAVGTYSREREDRIRQLEDILDTCETSNAKHLARIEQLEQLCRDMYKMLAFTLDGEPGELASQVGLAKSIHDRMVSYGLMLDEWKRSE